MKNQYDHTSIESKWQAAWADANTFATPDITDPRPKKYILDFFPYPSGAGLHVGHLLGYTGSDVLARTARKQGFAVLHPMGWDAFGLPAENYAIKSGVHPAVSTPKNAVEFKRQLSAVGMSYDWDREINASEPEYYRWTQWMFQLMYERGLAYKKKGMVNWCSSCQTVLANEQVVGGKCERCSTDVVQRELEQWYFKITEYAERLLNDLETIDWPEKIKAMQRNWIGKSTGSSLTFAVQNHQASIEVFTTRADTLFGATFVVLAPEHPSLKIIVPATHQAAVAEYQAVTAKASELERTFLDREKTGVFTGAFAINPATKQPVPIWIADYVLSTYGTGAVMAVPAHDERDFAFAQKFDLPIIRVIAEGELPSAEYGTLVDSGSFSGAKSEEAKKAITEHVGGKLTTTYRLRDWLVSRQRFWGAPIPVRYDEHGVESLVPKDQLPVELPMDVEFKPTGQSPLAVATHWNTYTDPVDGKTYHREVDTLDTFVCSSWYYLRFANPHIHDVAFDHEAVERWLPTDMYIGGAEHAVLHLLYARFFTKVLFDAGLVSFQEPFHALRNQGMILGPDHQKMSKSKGNVITPDDVVTEFGADCLRVYELFMGPFDQEKPWNTSGIAGSRRFLERVWRLHEKVTNAAPTDQEKRVSNKLTKKVTTDIPNLQFNTAIAAMMEALNELSGMVSISKQTYKVFITLLNPFAPHMTEELWQAMGHMDMCSTAPLPEVDESYLVEETAEYAVQIDGKVRASIPLDRNLDAEAVLAAVLADPKVAERMIGRVLVRHVIVPGRLVSLVTSVAV